MKESNAQTRWKTYIDNHPPKTSETHELKFVNLEKTKSFAFDRVADHQVYYLLASSTGMYYKIPDMAAISGYTSPKPFDNFYLRGVPGYVVIVAWQPRKSMVAYKIPIKSFIKVKDSSSKKSIRVEDIPSIEGIQTIEI